MQQQVELGGGQVHLHVLEPGTPGTGIEAEATERHQRRGRRLPDQLLGPLHPAEQCRHPGHELTHPERLGQVVVGTHAQPDEHVGLVVTGGEHQHRHRALLLDAPAHLEPVEAGQHHVEDDQVRLVLLVRRHRPGPVVRRHHVVPLGPQPVTHRLVDQRLVLDHEHGRRRRARRSMSGA